MDISLHIIVIYIAGLSILNLSLVIWLGGRAFTPRVYALTIFFVALWSFTRGAFHSIDPLMENVVLFSTSFTPTDIATLLNKLSFILGGIIATSILVFSLAIPNDTFYKKITVLLLTLFFAHLYMYTDGGHFLGSAYYVGGLQGWVWEQGSLLFLYDVYFFTLWFSGLYVLARKAYHYSGIQKTRLRFIFWSTFIGLFPISLFTMIAPRFNIFSYDWLSPVLMLIWPVVLSYSIMKHQQMNVRVVSAELLLFILFLLLFVSIFI